MKQKIKNYFFALNLFFVVKTKIGSFILNLYIDNKNDWATWATKVSRARRRTKLF